MTARRVARLWTPLAASWLLMALELPLLTAVVARMDDPAVHLAAYGGIVFPIALVVEAPIIMLLAASTALCTHWRAYLQVRRFMLAAGAALTAVHAAIAFTPLYDLVATGVMDARPELVEPARLGLRIMTPWTWAIAYRRFQQGVLIRHEHSRAVGIGTGVRLLANATTLAVCCGLGLPGIAVGSCATVAGVVTEAAWVGWRVRPVLREHVAPAPAVGEVLGVRSFLAFYVPLALTPVVTLFIQPLGAAAMSRMPADLLSLAAWPAVHGLVFMTRSAGMALNEVVVTLVDRPGATAALRRFTRLLAGATVALLALVAATPLGGLWFGTISGLPSELAALCRIAVALAVLMPGYAAYQSLYQGALVRRRTTRAITEAVLLYFALTAVLLVLGVARGAVAGIHWAVVSFTVAGLTQTAWLRWRSRDTLASFAHAHERAAAVGAAAHEAPARG